MVNKKIVGYTTGTFDMFHVGHLNILKKAKEQCDYLIVGVSTDDLVKSYKNKVPIISFEDRKAIVESIKYVDEVIPQVNRDKLDAFKRIKFDIMFVGDDWRGTQLFDEVEKALNEQNVRVVYFPYTPNISSTLLREKLKQNEK